MAPAVHAHQVQSEDLATVERAPDGYAEHVRFHRRLGGVPRLPWPVDLHH